MVFEIILDNVQDIHNGNYVNSKVKYKQEGNRFTINFYDDNTGEFNTNGLPVHFAKSIVIGNYIHLQDNQNGILISIQETDKIKKDTIYKTIMDEFYNIASKKPTKSNKRKSKKRKSKKRKSKKRKSKKRKSKKK